MDNNKRQKDNNGNNNFFFAEQFGIENIVKYQAEKEKYGYDKMCMIKIENADLLLSYLGDDGYFSFLERVFGRIDAYMKRNNYRSFINPYIVDKSTVIITAQSSITQKLFLEITENLYLKFDYVMSGELDIPIIVRFVVIFKDDNMIKRAVEELCSEKNAQKNFIVCDNNVVSEDSINHELQMISVIRWAIEHDGVIPYYQGIYDNRRKCIDKYESLMRIIDKNGKIYSPFSFMEIAKKYHLYTQLSTRMIDRVLKDVEHRNITVSLNLSAYDIASSEVKDLIYKLLEKKKSKALLVFEILEDEIFKDILVLQDFIKRIGKYGVKVAIDDFGTGYSSLAEIAQVAPHYIKIEGTIVSSIHNSTNNKAVLELIVSLSKKMGIYTVAEHVENEKIQEYVEGLGIEFSQGFYFAKPAPIADLNFD